MLKAMTALGAHAAVVKVGPLTVTERFDVALASVAVRRGRMADLAKAAKAAGVPLPGPARYQAGAPWSAFWVAPEMWFVEAPFASHEAIAAPAERRLGRCGIRDRTDRCLGAPLTWRRLI